MFRQTVAVFLAFFVPALWSSGFCQQLRDPTRPPSWLLEPRSEVSPAKTSAGMVLQSVLISPNRRSAIIDGQLVGLGESVDGLRVVSIEEGAVTLKGAQGTRRLQLFPLVDKRQAVNHEAPAEGASRDEAKPPAGGTSMENG